MSKRMLMVAALVAVCAACAPKNPTLATAASCIGDSTYEQVKIMIEHDNAGKPTDIKDVPPVTIYWNPDPATPSHKGQVCWVIEPTNPGGPIKTLYQSLYINSHNGTALFGTWTTKKKNAGDLSLALASGLPNQKKHSGWEYDLKCGGIEVDPVIIVIDDSH